MILLMKFFLNFVWENKMNFKLKIINKIIKKNNKRKSKIKEKWYFNDIFIKYENKIEIWRI